MTSPPRDWFTVSQLMLPHTTFEEDIAVCGELGFGPGISEAKLPDGDDQDIIQSNERRRRHRRGIGTAYDRRA